jgi:hypothetical protein
MTAGGGGTAGGAGGNASISSGTLQATAAGAAGGKAIDFNGFSVTISGTGTTYGATA